MPIHRFTVNVPNPGAKAAATRLRLERVRPTDLKGLGLRLPGRALKLVDAGLSRDPCDPKPRERLTLTIPARDSIDVHVLIETAPTTGAGVVAFHLIDQRRAHQAGGVTVACVEPPVAEPPGQVIQVTRPCPIVLAGSVYAINAGDDPGKRPSRSTIPASAGLELVAPITNPRRTALSDAEVYLEHLGLSDAQFAPITWPAGRMAPGEIFYASWPLNTSEAAHGRYEASVVVVTRGSNPVRLPAKLSIGRPG